MPPSFVLWVLFDSSTKILQEQENILYSVSHLQQVASQGFSDIHLLTSALKINADKSKHGTV